MTLSHRIPCFALVGAAALLAPAAAIAQGQAHLNPDISVIADVRALAADATGDDLEIVLEEVEIGAQAYLSPFARGDVFIGLHEGETHVEEAYVTFTSLPGGLGLRVGRMLVDVGRYNVQHSHLFSFLDRPGFVREYLGEEGYGEVGVNPSLFVDLGAFPLTVSASVLNAGPGGHGEEHEHDAEAARSRFALLQDAENLEAEHGRALSDLAYNARATAFFTLSDSGTLEVGGGGGTAVLDVAEDLRSTWFGGDLKYKWRPSRDRSFTFGAEFLGNARDRHEEPELGPLSAAQHEDERVVSDTAVGFFAHADYQFRRHWNVGGLVDWFQLAEDPDEAVLGLGGFVGYSVFEESTVIRLLVRHDDMPGDLDAETSVQIQTVFSLGPHKPHQY